MMGRVNDVLNSGQNRGKSATRSRPLVEGHDCFEVARHNLEGE